MSRWKIGIVVLVMLLLTATASAQTVSVESATVNVNETTSIDITLDSAPNGLSGYMISISLSNPSIAEITNVSLPSWATDMGTTFNSGSAAISAADFGNAIQPNATNIPLATLTIKGNQVGTTEVLLSVTSMKDDQIPNQQINPSIQNGVITVIQIPPLPGAENPPTDTDNDGLYEDVDGDGMLTFEDVKLFFTDWMMDLIPSQYTQFFDFDGDNLLSFNDVRELFVEWMLS